MGSARMNLPIIAGLLCLAFTATSLAADEPASLRLSQARAHLPALIAYVDIVDADGRPGSAVAAEQLRATVGQHQAKVEGIQPFAGAGEGVAYVLLIDVSKSLKAEQFVQIRTALHNWTDAMQPQDRAAIMSFGSEVEVNEDFTGDGARLKAVVDSLGPTDNHTRLYGGLVEALELARRQDPSLPERRVVVVLSDGENDFDGGSSEQEVWDEMEKELFPIYAIGFYKKGQRSARTVFLEKLGRFARRSGGEYIEVEAGSKPLPEVYATMHGKIRQVFVARLSCPDCPGDGQLHALRLSLSVGDKVLPDVGLNVRLRPPPRGSTPPPPPPPSPEPTPLWVYVLGVAAALGLVGLIVHLVRGKKDSDGEKDSDGDMPPPPPQPDQEEIKEDEDENGNGGTVIPVAGKTLSISLTVVGRQEYSRTYSASLVESGVDVVVGRGPGCGIIIDDDSGISGEHCKLTLENGQVFVQDLDSTNGTLVDGVRIDERRRLEEGSLILLARTELRLSLGESSA